MGTFSQGGYAEGMTRDEAERAWLDELDRLNGVDGDRGGGVDLREITQVKCVREPVIGKKPTKAKATKPKTVTPNGKMVNGFMISNNIPGMSWSHDFIFGRKQEIVEYAVTLTEAKKAGERLSMRHNCEFGLFPCRLFQDARTKRLSQPPVSYIMKPVGGTEDKLGKWYFKGDFRE